MATVTVRPADRVLLVDGRPFFPIEAWQHEKFETPYPGFVSEGDVTVSSAHGNPIGAMHGGAQVMSSPEELDRFGLCKSNLMVCR